MALFKNHIYRTEVVTIQGEDLTITEPSAAQLTRHHENTIDKVAELNKGIEKSNSLTALITDKPDNIAELEKELSKLSFATTRLYLDINLSLIAVCLAKQFPDKPHSVIVEELMNEITNFEDVTLLVQACDKVCGVDLKA